MEVGGGMRTARHCAMRNEGGDGPRRGLSAYRPTPCPAGSQHSPSARATWTGGSVHSSHVGTKGVFCIVEILYINLFCL